MGDASAAAELTEHESWVAFQESDPAAALEILAKLRLKLAPHTLDPDHAASPPATASGESGSEDALEAKVLQTAISQHRAMLRAARCEATVARYLASDEARHRIEAAWRSLHTAAHEPPTAADAAGADGSGSESRHTAADSAGGAGAGAGAGTEAAGVTDSAGAVAADAAKAGGGGLERFVATATARALMGCIHSAERPLGVVLDDCIAKTACCLRFAAPAAATEARRRIVLRHRVGGVTAAHLALRDRAVPYVPFTGAATEWYDTATMIEASVGPPTTEESESSETSHPLVKEGTLMGYLLVRDGSYLCQLAVEPAFFRLGVGTMLVRAAAVLAQRAGQKLLTLDVRMGNNAIDMYRREGYVVKRCDWEKLNWHGDLYMEGVVSDLMARGGDWRLPWAPSSGE